MCLLVLAGAWVFWPAGSRPSAPKKNQPPHKIAATSGVATMRSGSTAPLIFAAGKAATNGAVAVARTNLFPYRLSNTSKSIGQLVNDPHAILLENAFIDTSAKLNLAIPKQLQAQGDPGAYIVQARGPVDAAFRADLAAAGAQIVSYIPNNAYLVRMSAAGAAAMSGNAGTAAVLPYEPAYKFSASLLGLATEQKSLPENEALTLGLFADSAPQTIAAIKKMGGTVVATDRSPFGPVVRVIPPANWTALAVLSGVQIVEPSRQRASANDLARVALGISTDTVTNANYMGLSGKNVMVEVNDTGIDAGHPDFSATGTAETGMAGPTRVIGNSADSLVDTNGHGTHVAGIIAGNGSESYTVTNTPPGSVTNADFRGKAPLATLYSVVALNDDATLDISDYDLQSIPALTNALISNNSWVYSGDNAYDLAAASYDAAVRDALPYVTGSQPVMFVFAAGNDGGGDENGSGGEPDTILSPGTAKDVITVGALEQMRNITNTYTPLNTTNPVAPWTKETDSSFQVADYSARGNVGIGSEGTYGRFKPDVVAPGSFVVSTRSEQWDTSAYYNPSNYYYNEFDEQVVDPNGVQYYNLPVPGNAVSVKITLTSDGTTPFPTNLLIYVRQADYPDPTTYDFVTSNNMVMIPPDGGGGYLTTILTNGFNYAIVNPTNFSVGYNLYTEIITTNDDGDYYEVLSNLNETLAPWYRYESGTSMAAPAVSGTLALIQDYFTNTLHAAPSPALLKAMLINGARTVGNYDFVVTNGINFQGWGQPEIPDSVPPGLTNQLSAYCSTFFLDQSPANALATGDSQSWVVTVDTNSGAQTLPLRVTLAWTDPPGNPAAAIKLVNNLDLMVSNNVTGDVYFGNDFPYNATFSEAWDTNGLPNLDAINNIENVFLPAANNGSYTVTVLGRSVNVNAVTAQTNNVVQDFALVISSGNGEVTNGISIAASAAPNVALRSPVTFVTTTNTLLMNQLAGGNTPLLGTNLVGAGVGYAPDAAITLGITNQWHFYVVTNTLGYTNAAFITFLSQTLATPRLGVFAEEEQNATQPEADIDLYVATEPALTNLDPNVISNCVAGLNGDGASLANGTGTEFVAYTNSVPNQIYYIGIKSETQEAAEYDFLPVFSQTPFSQSNSNGVTVNGLLLPVSIPDGTPAHPGVAYVFGLAIQPVEIQNVVVTNTFYHQNFADLVGVLTHNSKNVVLNNHNGVPLPGDISFIYDDGPTPVVGSQTSDGPGSLLNFQGQQGIGPWILTEVDNSLTQTGAVTGLTLFLKKHNDLGNGGIDVSIDAMGYFYGYIDVPPGATNLSISATNISATTPGYTLDPNNPGLLFEKLGEQPAPPPAVPLNYDKMVTLTNAGPLGPGGTINIGPSDVPRIQPGRYYVTLYNSSTSPQFYHIEASLELGQVATVDFGAGGPTNLLDDAAMYSSIFVTNTLPIAEMYVGLRVDHPRISDLVFHLISPDGTRYLLMENRGGTSTNGAGVTLVSTNDFPPVSYSGGPDPVTNVVPVGQNFDTVAIDYDFFDLPDEMTVYYQGGQVFDSGLISGAGTFHVSYGPGTSTNLTIIMNEFTNPAPTTEWNYTIHSIQTNYLYLTFTDDTNLTTTPIKFAVPPFVPTNYFLTGTTFSDFESAVPGDYAASSAVDGWNVISNQVSVVTDTNTADQGSNFLALANGTISTTVPTVPGVNYTLSFAYRGPGLMGWWRGETNANSSVNGNNPANVQGISYTNGEVGQAFIYNGSTSLITMPPSTSLAVSNLTIEGWVYSTDSTHIGPIIDYGGAGQNAPIQLWINTIGFNANTPNGLHGVIRTSSGALEVDAGTPGITVDQWCHVAFTVNAITRTGILYCNGIEVASASTPGPIDPLSLENVNIGYRDQNSSEIGAGDRFLGDLDEVSIYNRPLSASEIKAIYDKGPLGKFDPAVFSTSPAQSLAEAGVAVSGIAGSPILGDNTNWQQKTISFTATNTTTPVVITGMEPGMLLDSFTLQPLSNLIYQPEQSLDPLIGTSAFGLWQLEILDDRVGATNHTVLDDWQLQFVFANTNPVPANIGSGVTNFIPPGGLAWYEVDVPTNADYATNILTFATGPLNFWFSTNMPPTITDPASDVLLVSGSVSNSVTLGTNGSPVNVNPPAYIVPGAIYYLGIHNTNNFTVQYGVEVDFHLLNQLSGPVPFAFTEPATSLTGTNAQLNGMATPNGQPATAWFEWGQSTAYGLTTPPVNVGSGSNVVFVTSIISNLMVNLPYHYRLVVSSAYGVTYGFDHVFNQGTLLAWGADFQGQTTPVPPGLTNLVVGVGAGNDFSLALNNDGTVVAWGNDSQGQTNVPVALSNAVAVAGGYSHSLALRSDRTVTVWGDDTYGQTNVPPGLTNAVEAASGNYHCLALSADGLVTAWGRDNQGQTNVVAGLSNVVAVAGGDLDSLALKNDGTVVAWGDNADGETNVPPDLTNVVAIAAGYKHNLALKSDGTVTAWGFNGNGQTNVPASLTNVIAIAAGGYHCLALLNDGTVRFWGDSSSGQTNFYPANLTNAFTIAAGGFHNLAVNGKFALNVTNTPPYWTNGLNGTTVTVDELTTLTVNNTAADSNAPPQLLFYSLLNPPAYASIDSFNGIITLAPQAADGPATNLITTVATDNGYPPLSATNQFTVIVVSTNQTPPQTNTIPISGIVYTNIGGTNGFLLTWFAPSNALFQVQWSDNLPFTWQTFTNPPFVSYNTNAFTDPTNTQFNYFDDGSQAPFTGSRYYELILLGSAAGNTPPVLPVQMDQTINPLNPLVVTNTATDSDTPAQTLTYSLTSTVTGTNVPVISAVGIITWTPDVSQAGTSNVITTIATDNGTPSMSAMNSFAVIVNPVPDIGSVIYTNGGFLLTWWAPTNDIFQVQFTDNLSPMNWQNFSNLVTYTGPMTPTNGLFSFYDDGSEYPFTGLRFYQINLVGVTAPSLPPATNTVPISSIISTNGSFLLTWSATTNDQFNVRWTTNISSPIIWSTFPDTVISTNGTFTFMDTNAPMLMKFYELILLP
jgi:subtilisin-like proprotein convertase family protein